MRDRVEGGRGGLLLMRWRCCCRAIRAALEEAGAAEAGTKY